MAKFRFIWFWSFIVILILVEIKEGESNSRDEVSFREKTVEHVKDKINQTFSTSNSSVHHHHDEILKLLEKIHPMIKRETRMDFQIEEEGNNDSDASDEDVTTKKPRKNKKTKQPLRPDDEYDNDDISETDQGIVVDKPSKGSSSKPKKTKKKENGKVFFEERFTERAWESSWTYSKMEYGIDKERKKYEKFYRIRSRRGNKGGFDYGLVTSNKGSDEYAISASFQPFNSNDGPLVVQFLLHYQTIPHCEYVYLRLFDCKFKPEEFTAESPYLIQIGPNICTNEKKLSVTLTDPVKGERYVVGDSKQLQPVTSTALHMYSLIIQPDGNYQILINDKSAQNGSLTTIFPNYQGFSSICAVGLNIWHSILDKFFKGQIILDDILITSDLNYAEKRRTEILEIVVPDANTNSTTTKKKA